jgi:hypothetical protein
MRLGLQMCTPLHPPTVNFIVMYVTSMKLIMYASNNMDDSLHFFI